MPVTPDLDIVLKKNRLTAGLKKRRLSITPQPEKLISFVEGEIIYSRDEPFDGIYLIVEGSVRVKMVSEAGKKVQQRIANEFIGEYDPQNKAARSDSAVAEKYTLLYKLDRNDLKVLFGQHPELTANLFYFRGGAVDTPSPGVAGRQSGSSSQGAEAESTQAIIDNLFRKGPEIKRQTEEQLEKLTDHQASGEAASPDEEERPPAQPDQEPQTEKTQEAEEPTEETGEDRSMADFEALLQRAENSLGRFSKKSEDAASTAGDQDTEEDAETPSVAPQDTSQLADKEPETAPAADESEEDEYSFSFDQLPEEAAEDTLPQDTDESEEDLPAGDEPYTEGDETSSVSAEEELHADEPEDLPGTEAAPTTEQETEGEPSEAVSKPAADKEEDSWDSFMASLDTEEESVTEEEPVEPESARGELQRDDPPAEDAGKSALQHAEESDDEQPLSPQKEDTIEELTGNSEAVNEDEDDLLPIDQVDEEIDLDEPASDETDPTAGESAEPPTEPEPVIEELEKEEPFTEDETAAEAAPLEEELPDSKEEHEEESPPPLVDEFEDEETPSAMDHTPAGEEASEDAAEEEDAAGKPVKQTESYYNYYSDTFDDVPDVLPIDLIDNDLDEKEEELKSIESKHEFVEQNQEDMLPIDKMFMDEEKTTAGELEQQIEEKKQSTESVDTTLEDELEEITREPQSDKDIVVSYLDEPPSEEEQAASGDDAWSDFMSSIDDDSGRVSESDSEEDEKIDEVSRLLGDEETELSETGESVEPPHEEESEEAETKQTATRSDQIVLSSDDSFGDDDEREQEAEPPQPAEEQDERLPIDELEDAEEFDQEPVIEEMDDTPPGDQAVDEESDTPGKVALTEEAAASTEKPDEPEDLVEAFSHQFPAEALLQESIDKSRSFSPDKLALLLRSANSLLTSMVQGDTVKEILKTTNALFPAEAVVFYHRENVSTLHCSILKDGAIEKYSIPLISDILNSVFENNHSIGVEDPGAHSLYDREKDSLPDIDLALTYYFPVAQEEADRVDGVLQIVNPAEPESAREHLPVIRAYTLLAAKAIAHSEHVADGEAAGKAPTKLVLAAAGRLQDVRQAIIAKAARTADYEGEASLKTILGKQRAFDELIRQFETTLLTDSGQPALLPAAPGAQLDKLLSDFAEYGIPKNIKLLKKIDKQCTASYDPAALSCAMFMSLLFLADDLEGEGKLFVSLKPEDDHCKIIIKNTSAGLAAADVEELRSARMDSHIRSDFHFLYIAARHFVERVNGSCLLGARPNDGSWIIIKLSGGST